jgi:hypothetical protein
MFSRPFIFTVPVFAFIAFCAVQSYAAQEAAPAADSLAKPAASSNQPGEPDEPMSESRAEKPGSPDAAGGIPLHIHAEEAYGNTTLSPMIKPAAKLEKGKPANFTLTLMRDDEIITEDKLTERHTKKIHLILLDQSLQDFHHVHPVANKEGGFEFTFTPATGHNYMLWADVKTGNDAPQLVPMLLEGAEPCKESCAVKTPADKAEFGGNNAFLALNSPFVKAGVALEADLFITDAEGKPFAGLEPIMGAYGHAFAAYDDLSSVQHAHPRGAAPGKETDRGASPLSFSFMPMKKGFFKIYVQLHVDGKDVVLPFGVNVE